MREEEYLSKYYPKDFIKVGKKFFVLPQGFRLSVDIQEIGSTFTTADGTKRKDIIYKREKPEFKFETLTQEMFDSLFEIVRAVENAERGEERAVFLSRERMAKGEKNIYSLFKRIRVDTAEVKKWEHVFRSRGGFIYSGVTLRIN